MEHGMQGKNSITHRGAETHICWTYLEDDEQASLVNMKGMESKITG